ncbi:oligosaccharide flippase family protein [Eubacterium callanderi]|uniref:oligosaccharide flippase family protein n=1 Tax=Eubacterium callanderi TaxID=53442 RepID=UPI0011DDFDFC|nr:oligosaccharide flippase family protein [Eubacterium callanderi]MBV1681864.1 oligosaccharide flippase family protein [Eubacterium callanderi]WPK76454.1 Putative O-antigen transporter [Eubacterium callanderi]
MKKNKLLIKNTLMLYVLQFSNYIFSFITVPYQTRILGPSFYGKIGLATALMVYFQLFTDFGFILSATEEVALSRDNKKIISKVYTSVTALKTIFGFFSFIILGIVCAASVKFREDSLLYFLYLVGTIINSFLPDYLYRGLERMSDITYRTLFIKGLFTILIFVFLKRPEDYIVVPILIGIGNLIAVVWSNWHVQNRLEIQFLKISRNDIGITFKKSASFFLSRIMSTLYTATNTVILGMVGNNSTLVGYYTASDKLITTGKSALTPISDSVYPYMVKNKDFKLIKKLLKIFMPIICIGTVITFIFAREICIIIFGPEFSESGNILRALLPLAIITLPNYLFGFPTLSAMGLAKEANRSIYFSTTIHLINLGVFYFCGWLNVYTLAILSSVADGLCLLYRLFIVWKNKDLIKIS